MSLLRCTVDAMITRLERVREDYGGDTGVVLSGDDGGNYFGEIMWESPMLGLDGKPTMALYPNWRPLDFSDIWVLDEDGNVVEVERKNNG